MKKLTLLFGELSGIIGPILFGCTTLICAGLLSGYSHKRQFISELGATGMPKADLMNFLGFVPTGLMILLFGISLIVSYQKKMLAVIGSILIAVFGCGIFLAGIFSCDQGCPMEGSFESNIHQTIAPLTFIAAILGMLLLGIQFRIEPEWKNFWLYSVASGVLATLFLVALVKAIETGNLIGFWQRMLLATIFSWIVLIAFRLHKIVGFKKGAIKSSVP